MARAPRWKWGPIPARSPYHLRGDSQQDADLYVMINASESDETFQIQEGRPGEWRLVFDTGLSSPDDFSEQADRSCIASPAYVVHSRSIAGMTRDGLISSPSASQGRSDSPPVSTKRVPR